MDLSDLDDPPISVSVDAFLETQPSLRVARRLAVFGSSQSDVEPALYDEVEGLGRRLAELGWTVLSGGYGGLMHAISKGASEAGGEVYAVTHEVRPDEHANPYCDVEVRHADLLRRMRYLVETADAYLALPGGTGTLAELAVAWTYRKGLAPGRTRPPLLVWQDPWKELVFGLEGSPEFWRPDLEHLRWVQGADDAAQVLDEHVPVGQALQHYENQTPCRGKALEAYLSSTHRDVRSSFAGLGPVIWCPRDTPLERAEILSLAGALLRRKPAELQALEDLPFEDVSRTKDDTWTSEFSGPERGKFTVFSRARSLHLSEERIWLQEFESEYFKDHPKPLSKGGTGDRILRIVDLDRGWAVVAQCDTGRHVAVTAANPRRTRELREFVAVTLGG